MMNHFSNQNVYFQYLGTEQRRSNRRRNTSNSTAPPPALEDLTRPDQQQHSIFESGGGGGGGNTREESIVLGGERQNNWLMDAPSIDFHNPNLVFGNLLDDYPLEGGGDSHISRRFNPLREFRPSHRREYHLSEFCSLAQGKCSARQVPRGAGDRNSGAGG